MATARCDLATLRGRVIQALNAGQAGVWTTDLTTVPDTQRDDRRSNTEIDKAVLAADARVCDAICESAVNGYRPLFMAEVILTHGEQIPEHIGSIGRPLIQPYSGAEWILGHPKSADEIDSYRNDDNHLYDAITHDQSGSSLAGYFDYDAINQIFRFTGYAAKAMLATFTKTSACQAPVDYEDVDFGLALLALPKEGDSAPYVGLIGQQAVHCLREIKAGTEISPIDVPELAQIGTR